MRVILMNKNTEVLVAEYHEEAKYFTDILEVKNIDYAPLIVKKASIGDIEDSVNKVLSDWFQGRGIPEGRDKLDMLMDRLNISSPAVLLDKAFGLSLSDQYWIKPYDGEVKYEYINFFDNDFNDLEFTEATFTTNGPILSNITLLTPNNTTEGVLRKTWVIDKKIRYLLKAGLKSEVLQPFNEVLSSMICERLGFHHIPYTIDIVKGNIVSKCACFITTDTELIPAYQVLKNTNKENAYDNYVKILSDNGIEKAKEKVDNMFILDYLMLNNDRHLNNFGIIRDVNTLKWLDTAPIFDTGNSLNLLDYSDDEIVIEGNGRFFYNVDSFDNIIKRISNLKRIDISKLNGVVEEFDELLHRHQDITKMSDGRINRLCIILNSQINKLKMLIVTSR
ncbi:MAG: hypothetical protein RSB99_03340 [Bacilli bacterium]